LQTCTPAHVIIKIFYKNISVRQWIENNSRTGTFLSPCPPSNTYWGAAGTIRLSGLNRLRFQGAQRVLYRYITPNKLEVLGSSAQTISNGLLIYPKTNEDVTPWMNQLKSILTNNGFPPNSTCYTDGSYNQSKGSMWQYINR
jgi:hypothetical protein